MDYWITAIIVMFTNLANELGPHPVRFFRNFPSVLSEMPVRRKTNPPDPGRFFNLFVIRMVTTNQSGHILRRAMELAN